MQPAEILELGETEVDIGTFEDFLAGIKGKYTQMTYNLMVSQAITKRSQYNAHAVSCWQQWRIENSPHQDCSTNSTTTIDRSETIAIILQMSALDSCSGTEFLTKSSSCRR